MDFIVSNFGIILLCICVVVYIGYMIYKFYLLSPVEKISKMKTYLYDLVVKAEYDFEHGANDEKFEAVWNGVIEKYPWVAKVYSLEQFNDLVNAALDQMKELLDEEEGNEK